MKNSLVISLLLISVSNLLGQKDFSNRLNVFSEAQRVVDSFVNYNTTNIDPQFGEVKWRLKDINTCVQIKPTKKTKPPKIFIKDFKSLDVQEQQVFDTLNHKYGNGYSTLNFYYKMVLHWLLPHVLYHQIQRPIKRRYFSSSSNFAIAGESLIDMKTYPFMVKTELNLGFQDFHSMITDIIQFTRPKDVVYLQEAYERPIQMNLLLLRLYLNASSMDAALEYLVSGHDVAPITFYGDQLDTLYDRKVKSIIKEYIVEYLDPADLHWDAEIDSSKSQTELIEHILKQKRLKINIKSYSRLLGSEQAFLKDVQAKYGSKEDPVDFYYKLICHWLLPQELLKISLELDQVELEEQKVTLPHATLEFMSKKGSLSHFEDFNRLCRVIISLMEQQRTQEQISEWGNKSLDPKAEFTLYKNAKQMITAMEGKVRSSRYE